MNVWIEADALPDAATAGRYRDGTRAAAVQNGILQSSSPVRSRSAGTVQYRQDRFVLEVRKEYGQGRFWRVVEDHSTPGDFARYPGRMRGTWDLAAGDKGIPSLSLRDEIESSPPMVIGDYPFNAGKFSWPDESPGRWRRIPKRMPPQAVNDVWVGAAFRGGFEAPGAAAKTGSLTTMVLACLFRARNSEERVFATLEIEDRSSSAEVYQVVCTGIRRPEQLTSGHLQDGKGWNLTFDPTFSGIVGAVSFSAAGGLRTMDHVAAAVAQRRDGLLNFQAAVISRTAVDWSEPSVAAFAAGAGSVNLAEFQYVTVCKLQRTNISFKAKA